MRYEQSKIRPISRKGGVDKFLFEEAFIWSTAYLLNPCIQQAVVTNGTLFSEAISISWISYKE